MAGAAADGELRDLIVVSDRHPGFRVSRSIALNIPDLNGFLLKTNAQRKEDNSLTFELGVFNGKALQWQLFIRKSRQTNLIGTLELLPDATNPVPFTKISGDLYVQAGATRVNKVGETLIVGWKVSNEFDLNVIKANLPQRENRIQFCLVLNVFGSNLPNPTYLKDLYPDLSHDYNGGNTDVTFLVQKPENSLEYIHISAHREVLMARSAVFERMIGPDAHFAEQWTGFVRIHDCSPNAFHTFLHFLSTGCLRGDWTKPSIFMDLVNACEKYGIPDLKLILDKHSMCALDSNEAYHWFHFTGAFGLTQGQGEVEDLLMSGRGHLRRVLNR